MMCRMSCGGLPMAALVACNQVDVSRASAGADCWGFGLRDHMVGRAADIGDVARRVLLSGIGPAALAGAVAGEPRAARRRACPKPW